MTRTILAAAALLAGFAATARPALADKAAVVVAGPEERRESRVLVDDVARKRVELQRWSIAETGPLTTTEIREMVACLGSRKPPGAAPPSTSADGTRACVQVLVGQVVADRLLVVSVTADARTSDDTVLAAWLLDGSGGLIATTTQRCSRCRPILLEQVTGDVFATLWREARARSGKGTLQIRSVPTGAAIMIDGKPSGTTDSDVEVAPGTHTITLRRDGFDPASRSVKVRSGEVVPVPVELVAEGSAPGSGSGGTDSGGSPWFSSRYLVPGILAGIGVTAVATGAILVVNDEDPTTSGPIDDPYYHDTAPAGFVVGALGVAAIGAGIAWYILDPLGATPARGEVEAKRWTPSTAPVAGGWSVGVVGRF